MSSRRVGPVGCQPSRSRVMVLVAARSAARKRPTNGISSAICCAGASERLQRAAMELFAEHGFDATTVAEIAERAGVTERTFFRHFADKREVLFAGEDELTAAFVDAI